MRRERERYIPKKKIEKQKVSLHFRPHLLTTLSALYVRTYYYIVVPVYPFFVVTSPWSILAFLPLKFQHRVKRKRHNGCITFFCRAGPRNRRCVTQLIIFEPPPQWKCFWTCSTYLVALFRFFLKGLDKLLSCYVHMYIFCHIVRLFSFESCWGKADELPQHYSSCIFGGFPDLKYALAVVLCDQRPAIYIWCSIKSSELAWQPREVDWFWWIEGSPYLHRW